MKLTVLGSGGCAVIPKPCCFCRVCQQAREKGIPYARSGPALFFHGINLLVDTPAEIVQQLNRCAVDAVDYLMFTHTDPDHVEGFRVVEQIALDFRTWKNYGEKQVTLVLPQYLHERIQRVCSAYGPLLSFYLQQGYVCTSVFQETTTIGAVHVTALPVDRGEQTVYIYVFEASGKKIVYAPCDIRPFPENRPEVYGADLLLIQPGIFEEGLKHGFVYPSDHVSRTTLYTFHQTLALVRRISARQTVFVHMEEYWNRSHDDYLELERVHSNIRFAYDGMELTI